MAKFQALQFTNRTVVINGKRVQFKDGYLETNNKDIIDALKKDGSIVTISETSTKKTDVTANKEKE